MADVIRFRVANGTVTVHAEFDSHEEDAKRALWHATRADVYLRSATDVEPPGFVPMRLIRPAEGEVRTWGNTPDPWASIDEVIKNYTTGG